MKPPPLRRIIYRDLPVYIVGVIGILISMGLGLIALLNAQWNTFYFLLVLSLLFLFLISANLWVANELRRNPDFALLFDMSGIEPEDSFVVIDLGWREAGLRLHRRLRRGKLYLIDVYNPQLSPSAALVRTRRLRRRLPDDPRLDIRDGQFNLLSLPDKSIPAVMLPGILSQIWQQGDRQMLLNEAYRILKPGGRLLVSENVRTPSNWVLRGPAAISLKSAAEWQGIVEQAGFQMKQLRMHLDTIACLRADRPTAEQAQQLIFDFGISR